MIGLASRGQMPIAKPMPKPLVPQIGVRIIGYGLCGKGEARRYMRRTFEEFKRLCDDTIILVNERVAGDCNEEVALIKEFGFKYVIDRREWGKLQWKMKEDFVSMAVGKLAKERDMLVCLDMDEVFCHHLTKEWLLSAPLDAYYCYFAELWNDEKHHKARLSFWNVRLWRWNGNTTWKKKPLHCGLAPEWAYKYHRFAPFVVLHYGTMLKEDRRKKIERYAHYDPNAIHLERDAYYTILNDDRAELLDLPGLCAKVEHEVATYQQSKPKMSTAPKKIKYFYVKNPAGTVLDIPEKDLAETLKRKGFELIGEAEDTEAAMKDIFDDVAVSDHEEEAEAPTRREGNYQAPVNASEEALGDDALESMADEADKLDNTAESAENTSDTASKAKKTTPRKPRAKKVK